MCSTSLNGLLQNLMILVMIEVGIRCKEYPASVEFVIHNLLFLCTSLRWLIKLKFSMPMDGNDGVERIMRTSPMGKNKAV